MAIGNGKKRTEWRNTWTVGLTCPGEGGQVKVTARLLAWAARWMTMHFLRQGMPMEGQFKEKSLLPLRPESQLSGYI